MKTPMILIIIISLVFFAKPCSIFNPQDSDHAHNNTMNFKNSEVTNSSKETAEDIFDLMLDIILDSVAVTSDKLDISETSVVTSARLGIFKIFTIDKQSKGS
ncbi:7143_t:CDS:2 [Gigaspora rosea]|nr:7143_t:CDS:2 [Gigaspora rosea]